LLLAAAAVLLRPRRRRQRLLSLSAPSAAASRTPRKPEDRSRNDDSRTPCTTHIRDLGCFLASEYVTVAAIMYKRGRTREKHDLPQAPSPAAGVGARLTTFSNQLHAHARTRPHARGSASIAMGESLELEAARCDDPRQQPRCAMNPAHHAQHGPTRCSLRACPASAARPASRLHHGLIRHVNSRSLPSEAACLSRKAGSTRRTSSASPPASRPTYDRPRPSRGARSEQRTTGAS